MSRRHRAETREIMPDPKFGNIVVTKFMNSIMHAGKKSVAEHIVYGAPEWTRAPRLPLIGQEREFVIATVQAAVAGLKARAGKVAA